MLCKSVGPAPLTPRAAQAALEEHAASPTAVQDYRPMYDGRQETIL